jgi:predicted transcriptional regulator
MVPRMPTEKPSKLELYIEILRSLEKLQSSNILTIQEATNIEQTFLRRAMAFLEAQNLIRKENIENDTVYMTTPRGDRVSRYFTCGPEPKQSEADSITNLA